MSRGTLFWSIWCVGALLFAVMAGFAAATFCFPADLRLAHWVQGWDGFGPFADFANVLGDVPVAALLTLTIAGVLAIAGRVREAVLVVLTFVPRLLRTPLAELVARPRPSPDLVQVSDSASGHSFPSGHVVGAVVLFGLLFVLAGSLIPHRGLRFIVRLFCVFVVLATGPARVYAGVHWPSDVMGGYLFGLLALILFCRAYYGRLGSQGGQSREGGR